MDKVRGFLLIRKHFLMVVYPKPRFQSQTELWIWIVCLPLRFLYYSEFHLIMLIVDKTRSFLPTLLGKPRKGRPSTNSAFLLQFLQWHKQKDVVHVANLSLSCAFHISSRFFSTPICTHQDQVSLLDPIGHFMLHLRLHLWRIETVLTG